MRAAGITAGIAKVLSPEQELSPRQRGAEVSGGVEFDVVVGVGRAELVAVTGLWRVVGEAQIDVGLLGARRRRRRSFSAYSASSAGLLVTR